MDPFGSEQGLVVGSCEYSDESAGSTATELISSLCHIMGHDVSREQKMQ
jgi:hypothetical protein